MSETPTRYCGNCGHELDPEDRFCQNCGRPVHQTAQVPTPEADVPVPPPPQQEQAGARIIGLAGGASTSFGDLTIWGVVSLVLSILSYFGWREKRKRRREVSARVI
jgi:hypothetical protein